MRDGREKATDERVEDAGALCVGRGIEARRNGYDFRAIRIVNHHYSGPPGAVKRCDRCGAPAEGS
jgi:hypothetical protein